MMSTFAFKPKGDNTIQCNYIDLRRRNSPLVRLRDRDSYEKDFSYIVPVFDNFDIDITSHEPFW